MIALRDKVYYVPGLPKDLQIISPQVIQTPVRYKGTFIAHYNDENDGYTDLNLKEDKPGVQKDEPVERVCVKYEPKNNIPNHEAILHNQR